MISSDKHAIEVHSLSKRFGEVQAVTDVNFCVESGEIFGFLGPNGAGKTTTINMLTGLARPDTGTILIDGIDCTHRQRAAQRHIGVVPDESNLYPELTGYDNLCFCAALYGLGKAQRRSRAKELLHIFGLSGAANRLFGGYSKGMKRKLTIAAGIIHNPKILFLDEPTTGIDVASARQIRQLIADLNTNGTTILLTTHYIEEAERLCRRIAFIVSGRTVRIDTVDNLMQPIQNIHVLDIHCTSGLDGIQNQLVDGFPNLLFTFPKHGVIKIESDEQIHVGPLIRFLEDQEIDVIEARRMRPSLEDVFVKITGLETDLMKKEKK